MLWKLQMPRIIGLGGSQPRTLEGILGGSFRNFFRKVPAILGAWPTMVHFCSGGWEPNFMDKRFCGRLIFSADLVVASKQVLLLVCEDSVDAGPSLSTKIEVTGAARDCNPRLKICTNSVTQRFFGGCFGNFSLLGAGGGGGEE